MVAEFKESASLYHKVNVDGTRILLELVDQIDPIKAFVYTFSAFVIHDSINNLVNANEFLPFLRYLKQTEIYSHTKGLAEDLVLASNRKRLGMLTVVIRLAGIFGEEEVQMLSNMLNVYYTGKTEVQLGNNKN